MLLQIVVSNRVLILPFLEFLLLRQVLLLRCHLSGTFSRATFSRVIRVGSSGDLLHNLPLLPVIVVTFILDALLFDGILLVLSLQVVLELAELCFDLVFSILAYHFDGA